MKQKIYRLYQIFFAILLLLLATNCTQDNFSEIESIQSQDEIQSLEQSPYALDIVSLDDVPTLNKIIFSSSNRGQKFQSVEGQPDNEVSPVFDTQSIMKVTDTLGFSNYSIRFSMPDRPEQVFYNLIVGQQADGTFVNPYVLRYVSDSLSYNDFKKNGFDLSFFRGKVSVHRFDDFFSQETSIGDLVKVNQANSHKNATALPTQCPIQLDEFGDPVPCIIEVVSGGGTSGGSSGAGGGIPTQSGNACTILGEWHNCGGTNGHIAHSSDVCRGDGLGAFWIIRVFCQEKQMRANNRYGATNAVGDCSDCAINTSGGIGVNGGVNTLTNTSIEDINLLTNLPTHPVWKDKKGMLFNKTQFAYSNIATFSFGTMYKLDNGLILFEANRKLAINGEISENINDAFVTKFSTESSDQKFYYLNNPTEGITVWYEYKIPPPLFASTDLDFLFKGFWDASKILGRYFTPLEDAIILIDGKDLDGLDANRGLAAGMLVVSVVPGGKLLKPLSKFLKSGIITLSFVKTVGGKMVAQAVGEAVNVEIRAIQREGFIFYKNVFGEEVARIADNVLVVTRHKILPKEGSVFFREAFEVNDIIKRQSTNLKPFQPPFKEVVTEFVTQAPEQFVRLHGDANQISSWIMKASEVKGLSLEQIIEKFALPLEPNQITKASFVNVPAGTKLFAGKANAIFNKTGGGFQFYIDKGQVIEDRWFRNFDGTIQEFLNGL